MHQLLILCFEGVASPPVRVSHHGCWHRAVTETLLLRWMGGQTSRRKALMFASHGYTWVCRDQSWRFLTCSVACCSFLSKLSTAPWFFLLSGVPWESEGLTSSEHEQDISNWFSPLLSHWKMAANEFLKRNRGTEGTLISKQLDHMDVHEHIYSQLAEPICFIGFACVWS